MSGKILSVNISTERGKKKTPVESIEVKPGHGIVGDAHGGFLPLREISLLAIESHQKMIDKGVAVKPGDFAENITTEGIDIPMLPVGSLLRCGEAEFEVTQIGKECHHHCEIFRQIGDCVMPREGIFVRTLKPGVIRPGDVLEIIRQADA